jgi:hypothetical protein
MSTDRWQKVMKKMAFTVPPTADYGGVLVSHITVVPNLLAKSQLLKFIQPLLECPKVFQIGIFFLSASDSGPQCFKDVLKVPQKRS